MVKMGRPTDNPKTEVIAIRLTKTDKEFLSEYAKKNQLSYTDIFTNYIGLLKGQKKWVNAKSIKPTR